MPCPEAMAVEIVCIGARDHMPPHAQGSSDHSTVLPSLQQQHDPRVAEQQGMAAVLGQTTPALDAVGSPSSSGKCQAGQHDMHDHTCQHSCLETTCAPHNRSLCNAGCAATHCSCTSLCLSGAQNKSQHRSRQLRSFILWDTSAMQVGPRPSIQRGHLGICLSCL